MDDYGLTVEVRQKPGHVLLTVTGEVDIATVPQLQERLAGPPASGCSPSPAWTARYRSPAP